MKQPHATPKVNPIPKQEEIKTADDERRREPEVDHFSEIAELVSGLDNTTPSGANTIGQKIMFHLNAIHDPKAFEASEAERRKAEKKQSEEDAKRLALIKNEAKGEALG